MQRNERLAFGRVAGERVARPSLLGLSEGVSRNRRAGCVILGLLAQGALIVSGCTHASVTPRPRAAVVRDRYVVIFGISDEDPSLVDWSLNVEPSGVLTGYPHTQLAVTDEGIDRFCHGPPRSGDVMTLDLSVQHDDQVSVKRLAEAIGRIIRRAEQSLDARYSLVIYVDSPTMTEAQKLTGSYPDGALQLGRDRTAPPPSSNKGTTRPSTAPTWVPDNDLPPLVPNPLAPPATGP